MYRKLMFVCMFFIVLSCNPKISEIDVVKRQEIQQRVRDIDTREGRLKEIKALYWRVDADIEQLNNNTDLYPEYIIAIAEMYHTQATILTQISEMEE